MIFDIVCLSDFSRWTGLSKRLKSVPFLESRARVQTTITSHLGKIAHTNHK
jgi:hypothetical protein